MQTCLIFNPSARGQRAESFCAQLGSLYPNCVMRRTSAQGQARQLAAQAVREGFATIIAAGGDGTANEVVNGIADVPQGLASVRLGDCAFGHGQCLCARIGPAAGCGRRGQDTRCGTRDWRLTWVAPNSPRAGRSQCRHFLQLAGAGLDARAVELVNWELKKKTGPLAYVAAGWKALRENAASYHGGRRGHGCRASWCF